MSQMNIFECRIAAGKMKVHIELFDRFSIRGGILGMNVSLRPRVHARARNLQRNVCRS